MSLRNRANILDYQRKIFPKVLGESGKICNKTTTRKTLERFGEVEIVDETNCIQLDFGKKKGCPPGDSLCPVVFAIYLEVCFEISKN